MCLNMWETVCECVGVCLRLLIYMENGGLLRSIFIPPAHPVHRCLCICLSVYPSFHLFIFSCLQAAIFWIYHPCLIQYRNYIWNKTRWPSLQTQTWSFPITECIFIHWYHSNFPVITCFINYRASNCTFYPFMVTCNIVKCQRNKLLPVIIYIVTVTVTEK